MSATNLDLPVLISAEQIRRREFVTIRRGYDPDQVRTYLDQLADQIELMRVMLREAQQETEAALRTNAQPHQDPYEKLGERVVGVIREADRAAEAIATEAATNAERLTRDARADADRIRSDAQAKAEEARSRADAAVRAAREEADRTIAGLSTRRDALVDQLASMHERLMDVARDLESAMDVRVTLPAIASVDELFDEPAGPSAASTPSPPLTQHVPSPVSSEADEDETADEAGPTIVLEEADEVIYDHTPEDEEPMLDPSYEELWEGTNAIKLDLPEIPALDLEWGDEEEDRS